MNLIADFLGDALSLRDVTVTFENGKLLVQSDVGAIAYVDTNLKEFGFIKSFETNSIMVHEPKITTKGNVVTIKGKYFVLPSLYYYVQSYALEQQLDFAKWYLDVCETEDYLKVYDCVKPLLELSGQLKDFTINTTKDGVKPFNTKEMKQGIFIAESNNKLKVMGKV